MNGVEVVRAMGVGHALRGARRAGRETETCRRVLIEAAPGYGLPAFRQQVLVPPGADAMSVRQRRLSVGLFEHDDMFECRTEREQPLGEWRQTGADGQHTIRG